jgi:hypothetical protein
LLKFSKTGLLFVLLGFSTICSKIVTLELVIDKGEAFLFSNKLKIDANIL